MHFVADGRDGELHPEVGALEAAGGVAAAHVALARSARVRLAFPALDAQGERPGHPEHGELTLDHRRSVAVPLHRIALERDARELDGIEEIGRAQVLVARPRARAALVVAADARRRLNQEIHASGLRGGVERYLAARSVWTAA